MRRAFCLSVLSIVLFLMSFGNAFACGDKYLSVGRGARFQRGYVSHHPVSVAVFKSNVTARHDFLSRLSVAGHRLTVTDNAAKLDAMLATGKIDVVLADYQNAAMIESMLSTHQTKPIFLPVVDAGSSSTQDAERKYRCRLNTQSGKTEKNFLAVLDEAIDEKLKGLPVICDSAGK